ncbi:MAG: 1-deoxy-D-xylulose-5-phosphate synthase, partial [Clostridia bacterium]|nr:1-deoxy-D-xylulose-5-phosphate synthase [Clostridia bacterium]
MNEYKLLSGIKSPDDVKKLNKEQLPALCEEIRSFLIEKVSRNGGHLASNLGVVELSVALHRIFDCPSDRMIFDVGHQAYVHKMLTGRADRFDELRIPGGLSGFTRRDESPCDAFGAGHSGTALSAAVGFAEADKMQENDAVTVAVIGDGAFGGGMVQEALAHCSQNLRLIAILNENEMSIGKNTGALANYLAKIRSRPSYFRFKRRTARFLRRLPLLGKPLYKLLLATKIGMKNLFYGTNFYEDLGF